MSRLGKYYLQMKHLSNWGPSLYKSIVSSAESNLPLCLLSIPENSELRMMPCSLLHRSEHLCLPQWACWNQAPCLLSFFTSPLGLYQVHCHTALGSWSTITLHFSFFYLQCGAHAICLCKAFYSLHLGKSWPSFKEGYSQVQHLLRIFLQCFSISKVGWERKSGRKIMKKSVSIFYFIFNFYFHIFSNA